MSANENNLIWIDLEMTGLDPEHDRIIEIATLVTDANLNILAEGPTIAVHQSDEQLALMDDWNVRTHTGSGLVDRVKASTMGIVKLNWLRWLFERVGSRREITYLRQQHRSGSSFPV